MSSSNGPGDGACRLHLGESFVCLERPGHPGERRACAVGAPDYLAAIRELAGLCDGPVTAVLPAGVFAVVPLGRGPLARLRARRALARALGVAWSGLLVAAGRAEGRVRLVGLPAEAMRETVRFLGAQGVRAAALEPAPTLVTGGRVPAFPVRVRVGTAPPGPVRAAGLRLVPGRRAWIAGSAASAAALAVLVATFGGSDGREPARAEQPFAAAPGKPLVAVSEREGAPEVKAPPPEVHAAAPALRAARSTDRPSFALLRSDAPPKRDPAALLRARAERPSAVMASRSVPPEVREAALAAVGRAAEGERMAAHRRTAELGPVPRPGGSDAGAVRDPGDAVGAPLRPLSRPGMPAGGPAEGPDLAAVSDFDADGRPRPRPSDPAERLARAVEAAVSAAVPNVQADRTGGSPASGIRPEPRSVVAEAGPAVAALRVTPPMDAAPAGASAAPPMQLRAAPVQVARAEPARPAPPLVQAQPVRQAPPARTVSRGSGSVALVGVFGTASRRHALVRLPNGSIQRVRPGDAVNGVQIAAVGEDSVRVRVNGRDGVLRLPD